MPLPTVLVCGTFYYPDNSFASFADVRFVLSGIGIYVDDILLPRVVSAKCDIGGFFSVNLAPSPQGTHYTCYASIGNTQIFDEVVVVPSVDCNISLIIQLDAPPLDVAIEVMLSAQTMLAQAAAIESSALATIQSAAAEIEAKRLAIVNIAQAGGVFKRYVFESSLEWRVTHAMGVDAFTESLHDSDGNRFYAGLRIVSLDEFVITLTEMTAGTVNVFFKS